jgi:hypothetical protein
LDQARCVHLVLSAETREQSCRVLNCLACWLMRSLAVLLVEQVDRLSRRTSADWEKLKAELTAPLCVLALDLPTSWMMATNDADEFTGRTFEAIKEWCWIC